MKLRRLLVLIALAATCCLAATGEEAASYTVELGTPQDGASDRDVVLHPAWSFWGGGKWKEFIRYENDEHFWWATTPPDPSKTVAARVLKSHYAGELRARAFDSKPKTVYVAIRFKDNLVTPATVWFHDGSRFVQFGDMGGALDRQWKTATFEVASKRLGVASKRYRFRIGSGDYGDLMGDLPLDRVTVSTTPIEAESDEPGFYPTRPDTPFDNIAGTQVYRDGAGPMFPVGPCLKGLRMATFDQVAKAGFNAALLMGWEDKWQPHLRQYASGDWTDRLDAGLINRLDLFRAAGVLYGPNFFTDTRSYWIDRQYGSERSALRAMEEVMKGVRNHPALLAWWIKDEADHDDPTWGAPEEFVQQLYNAQKRADPKRPAFVNFQGWKPQQYPRYLDAADIVGFDLYPIGQGKTAGPIGVFADRMRDEVKGRRALWAIVEGHEGIHRKKMGRPLTKQETLVQGYMALVHGMQGVFWYIGNEGAYIDPSEIPGVWSGMSQFANEVLGEDGIEPFLVPPAKAVRLARSGENGLSSNARVHAALFEKKDGSRLLVAVNEGPDPLTDVSLTWPGLSDGIVVEVRFEDREEKIAGGAIADDFQAWERHVYLWEPSTEGP